MSPEDQVRYEVEITRNAYKDGKAAGSLDGHRLGFDTGYTAGFAEGVRSSIVYQQGYRDGWQAGYVDRISDEEARRRTAA